MIKQFKYWTLPIISGILMGICWPETGGWTYLVFFALFPLLYFEDYHYRHELPAGIFKTFIAAYLTFFLFNFITTWWIKFASVPGMWMAEILNSLFMALVFTLYSFTKRNIGQLPGVLALVIYWLAFEWVHYNWELSWVWLSLGNVFAAKHQWVQWYEYTGVLGGSLWVLLTNVFLLLIIDSLRSKKGFSRILLFRVMVLISLLSLPIVGSMHIYNNYSEEIQPTEIVVVQPNIDPYREKFQGMSESKQIELLVELAESQISPETDFVVCPETAFPMGYWEHELHLIYGTEKFKELIAKHPNLRVVTGLSSMRLYAPGEKPSVTARQFNDGTQNHYDYYNTAMQLDASSKIQLYHKSKLVLGVEKMPFGSLLKPLEKLAINLGGASGSLGFENEAFNFTATNQLQNQSPVAPVICYESVYGEYLTTYVKKGAELIFIITNDGWWEDTPGYRQHLAYAKLRAIECRRSIARSANTGISAFINQRGDVVQSSAWWERMAMKNTLNASSKITSYVINGDFIGRVSGFFSLLLIALLSVKLLKKKKGIRS